VKIIVNGKEKTTQAKTIKALLEELNLNEKIMATAVNMNVVKKEHWNEFKLKENDKVEFLQFVGGG